MSCFSVPRLRDTYRVAFIIACGVASTNFLFLIYHKSSNKPPGRFIVCLKFVATVVDFVYSLLIPHETKRVVSDMRNLVKIHYNALSHQAGFARIINVASRTFNRVARWRNSVFVSFSTVLSNVKMATVNNTFTSSNCATASCSQTVSTRKGRTWWTNYHARHELS